MQHYRRRTTRELRDFEVVPGNAAAPTSSEGFHAGFFGREARGEAFVAVHAPLRVRNFARSVDAFLEALAVLRLQGFPNARHLAQVDARSDDHFCQGSSGTG